MRRPWPRRLASFAGAMALGLGLVPFSISTAATAAPVHPRAASGPWTIQKSPNKPGAIASALTAVSCVRNGPCEAVGTYTLSTGLPKHQFALILKGSGGHWTLEPTPSVKGAGYTPLSGVSCASANSCLAVGYTVSRTKNNTVVAPLAERWNGTAWSRQSLPEPPKTVTDELTGVSCTAAAACTAVGDFATSNSTNPPSAPLAMLWNGTSWQLASTTDPAGGGGLRSVSCTSPTTCVAVGAAGTHTLVEVSPAG